MTLILSSAAVEDGFQQIEHAALNGLRCPINKTHGYGTLRMGVTSELVKQGRIRVEVYAHNWRVIEITSGPNAGKRTAPPPYKDWKPYKIYGWTTAEIGELRVRLSALFDDIDAAVWLALPHPQLDGRQPIYCSFELKSLTIVAVLLAGGTSLAIAQNGLPTGGESPVAGGVGGGGWGYAGGVYGYPGYPGYGYGYYPAYGYMYYPAYGYRT